MPKPIARHTTGDLLTFSSIMSNVNLEQYKNLIGSIISEPFKAPLLALLGNPFIQARLPLAPASSRVRYHHAYTGGLLTHIESVQSYMFWMTANPTPPGLPPCRITPNDIVVVSLLHDLHKLGDASGVDYYVPNMIKTGRSVAEPYKRDERYNASVYDVGQLRGGNGDHPYAQLILSRHAAGKHVGGGDYSLALVAHLSPVLFKLLTPDQVFAIRYHDGAYEAGKHDSDFAGKECPLQLILHCADMLSSREERNEEKKS